MRGRSLQIVPENDSVVVVIADYETQSLSDRDRPIVFPAGERKTEDVLTQDEKSRVAMRLIHLLARRFRGGFAFETRRLSEISGTLFHRPKQTCWMAIRELNVHRGWFTAR